MTAGYAYGAMTTRRVPRKERTVMIRIDDGTTELQLDVRTTDYVGRLSMVSESIHYDANVSDKGWMSMSLGYKELEMLADECMKLACQLRDIHGDK